MSTFLDAIRWLGDRAHYRGTNGLIHLAVLHLKVTGYAMGIALVIGLGVGLLLGHYRRGGPAVSLLANVTRAVPTLGLLLLLAGIPQFGVTQRTAVYALAAFAVPPILTNAWAGLSGVDPDALEAANGLGMSGRQRLLRVELPLALPLIAAGVRSSLLQTFATATIASYVGTPTLGTLIQLGQGAQDQVEVVGAAMAIGILAIALDVLLARVQAALTAGPRRAPWWRRARDLLAGRGLTTARPA